MRPLTNSTLHASPTLPCLACLQGEVVLVRQTDQPGIIAAVSSEFAKAAINISFMTVSRVSKGREAIMAIGVDETPSPAVSQAARQTAGLGWAGLGQAVGLARQLGLPAGVLLVQRWRRRRRGTGGAHSRRDSAQQPSISGAPASVHHSPLPALPLPAPPVPALPLPAFLPAGCGGHQPGEGHPRGDHLLREARRISR